MKRVLPFSAIAVIMLGTALPPPRAAPRAPAAAVSAPTEPERLALIPAPPPSNSPEMAPPAPAPEPAPPAAAPPKPGLAPAKPAPSSGGLRVVVSIAQQKAFVYQAGMLVASSPVSTGRRGHETPTGTFPILEKQVHHRSNLYSNAPMPYMQRLTVYGVALHAGHLPGYPASHGCIRLPWGFARKLYAMTAPGTVVTVTRQRVKPLKPLQYS